MSLLAYLLIILPMDLPLPRQVHADLFAALVRTAANPGAGGGSGKLEARRLPRGSAVVPGYLSRAARRPAARRRRPSAPSAKLRSPGPFRRGRGPLALRTPPAPVAPCRAHRRLARASQRRRPLLRLAATATDPSAWVRQRRTALAEMRQLLDHDRYYAAAWP